MRALTERQGWGFWVAFLILKPLVTLFTRPHWVDGTKIPAHGGAVVVANHLSHVDPLTFAHFVYAHGRLPRFLAKAGLFEVFFTGRILKATGQIPVSRETTDASRAFAAAVEAVEAGRLVVVYPEGTLTRQPDLWPMAGKTGAARIALTTSAPVVPVAQWGPQDILWPYAKRPRLLPPHTVHVKAGDPVELDDLRDREPTPEVLRQATDRIMAAVTALLEDLRGEPAPAERFDPRRAGVRPIGDPRGPAPHRTSHPRPARRRSR